MSDAPVLESIQRARIATEKRERERAARIQPRRLTLQQQHQDAWRTDLDSLKSRAFDEAATVLVCIGKQVCELVELDRQDRELTLAILAHRPEGHPPTIIERVKAIAEDRKGFRFDSPVVAAEVLSKAISGASASDLAESLKVMAGEEDCENAVGWMPYFRDRFLLAGTEPQPQGPHDMYDLFRADVYMGGIAFLRDGERLGIDSQNRLRGIAGRVVQRLEKSMDSGPRQDRRKTPVRRNAERDAWVARQRKKNPPTAWNEIYDDLAKIAAKRGWDIPRSPKSLTEAYYRHQEWERENKEK